MPKFTAQGCSSGGESGTILPKMSRARRRAVRTTAATPTATATTRQTDVRVGIGHDTHRLAEGRPLILGGVRIEHARGLVGHSDADVVLHAVADALLGAAALGDIGEHFPDTDPRWQGLDSGLLLTEVLDLVARAGWQPVNCDVIVHAQEPKLGPHKPALRANLARLLALDPTAVNVKAKTGEHVGPVGRGEAIACEAVVLLERG
jgi:2-C-methyl-D-erythritol 2,4-cyclodiphosphate synthase